MLLLLLLTDPLLYLMDAQVFSLKLLLGSYKLHLHSLASLPEYSDLVIEIVFGKSIELALGVKILGQSKGQLLFLFNEI